MAKSIRASAKKAEVPPSVFTDVISVADAFRQARRMGLNAEQFEKFTGASTSKLRRGRGGSEPVDAAGVEALRRCETVFLRAVALCGGDEKAAVSWASSAAPALKGKSPVEAAETRAGLTAVEKLFSQLEQALKASAP